MLLASCAGWQATPRAGFERMAAARLGICVADNHCSYINRCFAESEQYCLASGYSKRCGQMEPEGSCGDGL
jgi:hypothetical protein